MVKIEDLVIDKEFEKLLPVLTPDEFYKLEKSILKNGLLDPIKIWQDPKTKQWVIIDGHNRYKILKKNNISRRYWCDYKILYEDELPTREDVKQWMLEQQLGRRNLSEAERYEIVQKFKTVIKQKARENQSSGGKGLSNLSKVNTRKEMAKAVGVSEGTYQKMERVMESDNEELKQRLREKKISVDKAYQEVHSKKKPSYTPLQQIQKIDDRLDEVDREINELNVEKRELIRRRLSIFEALDIPCELKYEFVEKDPYLISRKCKFYIEVNGYRQNYVECNVYYDVNPADIWMSKIPEKYKCDFIMLWQKAHKEDIEWHKKQEEERNREWETFKKEYKESMEIDLKTSKDFYKQCYRVLAKSIHPDTGGDLEAMQYLNQLKSIWGV
ncbi:MAG: ParB N-terminal domain-containing protein [Lachnospiraceae bacterium]|nr:ParB N-terminal domain-containing protein [Lachnospiraceae bacterium]